MKKLKVLKYALHVAVLLGLAVAATKYINGGEFWKAIHRFNWLHAPLILALSVAYVVVKGWRFVFLLRQLTNANRWVVLRAYIAGQACTLLPGGIAARAALLEQVNVPIADSAAAIALSSLSDQVLLIICSLLAALWFEAARKPVLILLSGLLVLSLLLGAQATRMWLLRVVEKLLGTLHLLDYWKGFLDSMKQLATVPILLGGLGNTALSFMLMVWALDLSVRGVGAQASPLTLLLAFTLPSLLGRISAMPGGVGVTEAGMVGILDAAPNVTLDQAAAAVTIFRIGTTLFAAIFGGLVYFLSWRPTADAAQ